MRSELVAVLTYGALTALWGLIFVLYLRQRHATRDDGLVQALLAVLALDAFKSFFESLYFGLLWGSQWALLPEVFGVLGRAEFMTAVKLVNLGVAVIILLWLIRRWVPTELKERRERREAEATLRTELERSLAATRESEQRYRIAADVSRDVIWDWNPNTGVIETTGRIAELLGIDPAEWPATIEPWVKHLHPDDTERVREHARRFIAGELKTYDIRFRMLHADGRALSLSSSATLLKGADGKTIRLVGITRDLTLEVEAEQARLSAQKLESIGLLAGGVAHDFNNLLAVVSASLGVAQADKGVSTGTRESLGLASTAVQRAATLTRQLLAYAGRSASQKLAVDLNSTVRELNELISVSIPRKVRFSVELGDNLPAVLGDEGQLQQVVMNLVSNAAEAIGPNEGRVTLTTRLATVDGQRAVQLEVSDTGAGLTPEVQARMFDPFFSTKGSGRGLGLAALAGITRSHNASIAIDSAPGQGCVFTVSFTQLAAISPPPRAVVERPKGALTARVLLVDDEALLRRSASRLLSHLGCTVTEATDGDEAVEAVRRGPSSFDLVLMDVTMPRLSGVAAAKQILALAPTLPVVLSSGYSREALDDDGGLPSTVRTLSKPYRAEELERTLREALGSGPS